MRAWDSREIGTKTRYDVWLTTSIPVMGESAIEIMANQYFTYIRYNGYSLRMC